VAPRAALPEPAIQAARQYRANPASQLTSIPLGDYLVQHIRHKMDIAKRGLNGGPPLPGEGVAIPPFSLPQENSPTTLCPLFSQAIIALPITFEKFSHFV